MSEFFRSIRGAKFYDSDVPRIAVALERIATAFEVYNDAKERDEQEAKEATKAGQD